MTLEEIAAFFRCPKEWLLKLHKPGASSGAQAIPSEGATWPTPVAFTPTEGPPGSVMDAGGKLRYGMNATGKVPTEETRGAAIESSIDGIRYQLAGFMGEQSWKGPTSILLKEVTFQTNAGGDATPTIVASPGAGKKLRIVGAALRGTALAGGGYNCSSGNIFVTDGLAAGLPLNPCNILIAANTALTGVMSGGGNTITYSYVVAYRTEDA